jgi:hypothetical protein
MGSKPTWADFPFANAWLDVHIRVMAELRNDFSWSHSRDEKFQTCPRQYFYHYYGAWGGWETKADPKARTLYILRQLQTRQQWLGATVHNCVRWILTTLYKTGQTPDEEVALHQLSRRLQKDFEASGEGLYWHNPREHTALIEHEYDDLEVADEVWEETFEKAVRCVSAFFHSTILQDIGRVAADQWLELEERAHFMLDDIKVWVQLDFALRDAAGLRIFDWKTGKADLDVTRRQLALYALYAQDRWQATPDTITLVEFNLNNGDIFERQPTEADRAAVCDRVATSSAAMLALLEDPATPVAQEEKFALTDDEKACLRCPFRRICPKWADAM